MYIVTIYIPGPLKPLKMTIHTVTIYIPGPLKPLKMTIQAPVCRPRSDCSICILLVKRFGIFV